MTALIDAGYTDSLSQEISANLAPEGAPAYYFKFKGGDAGIKLSVQSFDLQSAKFEIEPTFDGTVTAFQVNVLFDDDTRIDDVLNVALPSSRRGHPPQINTGKNYNQLVSAG
jgi:hypothetical protein